MESIIALIDRINSIPDIELLIPIGFFGSLFYIARKYFWDGPSIEEKTTNQYSSK